MEIVIARLLGVSHSLGKDWIFWTCS